MRTTVEAFSLVFVVCTLAAQSQQEKNAPQPDTRTQDRVPVPAGVVKPAPPDGMPVLFPRHLDAMPVLLPKADPAMPFVPDDNRQQVRPQVWGWPRNVAPLNPGLDTVVVRTAGPQSLTEYATSEIEQMDLVCRLTKKQRRTLEVAAKGVAHRLKEAEAKIRVIAEPQKMGRGMVIRRLGGLRRVPTDRSAEFRGLLRTHPLWKKTVERTLTPKQLRQWNSVQFVKYSPAGVDEPASRPRGPATPKER